MAQHPDYPTDSKRLATLKVLTKHIEDTVNGTSSYKHNLVGKVWRGRYKFDKDDELPAVAILENIDPDRFPRLAGGEDELGSAISKESWMLLIQGWVKDDKLNPTDPAYELMADVRKALSLINLGPRGGAPRSAIFRLGGLITGLSMEPGIARPPAEQLSSKAYFWMRITLKFVEDPNNPYDHDIETGD